MRNLSGAVALSVSAVVCAFYLGGLAAGTRATTAEGAASLETAAAVPPPAESGAPELAVECEPGQRAVVRATAVAPPTVTCQSDPRPVSRAARFTTAAASAHVPGVVRVADWDDRPYARPAVITEPVEVYRLPVRRVSDETRAATAPTRTGKKSVAIIAGSTTAGAVMGGLVKGKKGAVVGGLLGGGAATVWDQVTRRQHDVR